MKLHHLGVALLATLLSTATAFAAPELSVDQGTYNFGTITQGNKVQHNFVIKNSGDSVLQIKEVTVSCGCTAAKPSTSTILPGKKAEIQVTFDSAGFSGKVEKTVTVTSNAAKSPSYTFNIVGSILEQLQVSPRQVSLGPLTSGSAKQAVVTVTNRSGSMVKILSANFSSSSMDAKATIKKSELKPGESGSVQLSVTAHPDAKVLSGYLHIVTNHPQKKEITVPVYASVPR
jgi:uncharacterized cupredoxin-like copper-binding protein